MKLSKMILGTLRDINNDVELDSYKFMLKSGMIKKNTSGLYSYMTLGCKAKDNIEKSLQRIVENLDGQKIELPTLVSEDIENQHNSYDSKEDKSFKVVDQNKRVFTLGGNEEILVTNLIKNYIKSYKQLPQITYNLQKQFIDCLKPKNGVIKNKEFTELNCYGFHKNENDADEYCSKITEGLSEFFHNINLNVEKTESSEFIISDIKADDFFAKCNKCRYLENINKAKCKIDKGLDIQEKALKKVATPDIKTIEQLCEFFNVPAGYFVKTIIYVINDKTVAVMVRGNREVNEDKVKNQFKNITKFELANEHIVKQCTSAEIGFAGPIGIKCDILFVDEEIRFMKNFMTGANETGYHYENANYIRDFNGTIGDFKKVKVGDLCNICGNELKVENSLIIAKVLNSGIVYSDKAEAHFLNEEGESKPLILTKCNINIDRILAAIIEKNNDENGIIWPKNIAPYKVEIIIAVFKDENQKKIAQEIYDSLKVKGISVLLDDRDERAGVKFKDADLIGAPIRITVGKKINEGKVEFKFRNETELKVVDVNSLYNIINEALKN